MISFEILMSIFQNYKIRNVKYMKKSLCKQLLLQVTKEVVNLARMKRKGLLK